MTFYHQARKHRFGCVVAIFLCFLNLVSSYESVPSNHHDTPDASTLKIEPRESEVSITLGKDLLLGPPLPSKTEVAANLSNFNDIPTTTDAFVTPAMIVGVAPDEKDRNTLRKAISKNSRGSHVFDSYHRANKGRKSVGKKDSYLEALRHSRNNDELPDGIVRTGSKTKANRREYSQGPVYKPEAGYGTPDSTYTSNNLRATYGRPISDSYPQSFKPSLDLNDQYGTQQNAYGSSQNSYGSLHVSPSSYPQTSYGPPANSYLPSPQAYGPSIHTSAPTAAYGAPYALPDVPHISIMPNIDLSWPFALKLNAFTIAKIILKLVIFKMIVKFIAAICLLLFIPKLEIIKKGDKDEEDEGRDLSSPYASFEKLNNLESMVKSSVEKFELQNNVRSNSTKACTTLACRISKALTLQEYWNDYVNLFKSYVEEERRSTKQR